MNTLEWIALVIAFGVIFYRLSKIEGKLGNLEKRLPKEEVDERLLKLTWKPTIYRRTRKQKASDMKSAALMAFLSTDGVPPAGMGPAEVAERLRFAKWLSEIDRINLSNPRREDIGEPKWNELMDVERWTGWLSAYYEPWWGQFLNPLDIKQYPILAKQYQETWGRPWGNFKSDPEYREKGQPALGDHNPEIWPPGTPWWKKVLGWLA